MWVNFLKDVSIGLTLVNKISYKNYLTLSHIKPNGNQVLKNMCCMIL